MDFKSSTATAIRSATGPVLVLSHAGIERVLRLDKEVTSIGSDPACDFVIVDPTVSPRHCIVQRVELEFEVFHLGGAAGTRVNGEPIEASALRNGDRLCVGDVAITLIDLTADILPPGLQLLGLPLAAAADALPEARVMGAPSSFEEALLDALRRTPWLLISAAIHALVYVMLIEFLSPEPPQPPPPPHLETDFDQLAEDDWDLTEEEADIVEIPEIIDEEVELPEFADLPPSEFEPDDMVPEDEDRERDERLAESVLGTRDALSAYDSGTAGRGNGGFGRDGIGKRLKSSVGRLRASGLDVAFLIDATGSMDDEIDAVKDRIGDMIALITSFGIDFRLGVVAFRDTGDAFVTKTLPLTSNVFEPVDFLDQLEAGGGGDIEEAVLQAIQAGVRLSWSSRAKKIMILVGDAPPHPQDLSRVLNTVAAFQAQDGYVHTIYTESEPSPFDPQNTPEIFRRIAEKGHGSAIELQRGDQLVEQILLLALEADDRTEIKALMADIGGSIKGRLLRKRFAKKDAALVAKQLAKKDLDPLVPLELFRNNDPAFLGAYIDVLLDPELPKNNRWLTTVLLRRLLRRIDRHDAVGDRARVAMAEFSPSDPLPKQERLLRAMARSLYDAGILELEGRKRPKPR